MVNKRKCWKRESRVKIRAVYLKMWLQQHSFTQFNQSPVWSTSGGTSGSCMLKMEAFWNHLEQNLPKCLWSKLQTWPMSSGEPARPSADGNHPPDRQRHLWPHLLHGREPGVPHQGDDLISEAAMSSQAQRHPPLTLWLFYRKAAKLFSQLEVDLKNLKKKEKNVPAAVSWQAGLVLLLFWKVFDG